MHATFTINLVNNLTFSRYVYTTSYLPIFNFLSIYYEAYNENSAMAEELSLPSYLQILPQRVILCTQHGSCYTASTLERHLIQKHHLKGDAKKAVLEQLEQVHIATDVKSVQQLISAGSDGCRHFGAFCMPVSVI
jgi:hypothetical protein